MSADVVPAAKGSASRRYSDSEIRDALAVLLVSGNVSKTAQRTGVPRQTLQGWRDEFHSDIWAELKQTYGPTIDRQMEAHLRELIVAQNEAELLATARLTEEIAELERRDLPAAMRNIAAAKNQNTEKLLLLTGRATAIVEHQDAAAIIDEIKAMIAPYAVDTTAETIDTVEA